MVAALVAVVAGLAYGLDAQRDVAEGPPHTGGHAEARESTGPDALAPDSAAPGGEASDSAVPAASEGPSALDRCRTQHAAQTAVLRTAARAISQWQVHVTAMNQLVAGEITLDQASDFWNRTRIGARGRVSDFDSAEETYAARPHDCPTARAVDAASLKACARAVALRDRVVSVARRSIDTWAGHVRDMERLRDGKLSPAKATELWQMSWHMGQHQIDAYDDAVRRADRAGDCPS